MVNLIADVMYWVLLLWVLAVPVCLVGAIVFSPYIGCDEEMADAVYAWKMAQEFGEAPQGDDMELFHEWWANQVNDNPAATSIINAF